MPRRNLMQWLWLVICLTSSKSRNARVLGLSQQKQQLPPSFSLRPRVISLNVMVAGLSGLGKTTLCEALLQSWIQQQDEISLRRLPAKTNLGFLPVSIPKMTQVVDPSRQFERYDEQTNTILRVRIIDTPGFGNRVNHRNAVRPIARYLHRCRAKQFRAEMASRLPDQDSTAACDDLVHVCLYFLSPGRFLSMDAYFVRRIQREVSVIPVVAKADTLTNEEIALYRAELVKAFAKQEIVPYNFDVSPAKKQQQQRVVTWTPVLASGSQTNNGNATRTINSTTPSNTKEEEEEEEEEENLQIPYSRGRRPGEALGVVSRDGRYPWGAIRSMDPVHSDLLFLRNLLLSQHTETFVQLARQKYGLYRTRRIRQRQASDVLKIAALALLTAKVLGVSIPWLDRISLQAWRAKGRQLWDCVCVMVVQLWKSLQMQSKIPDTVLETSSTTSQAAVPMADVLVDKPTSSRWFWKW